MNETTTETVRLPLWKNVLDELKADGVSYGQVIESKWLEEKLCQPRTTMQFGLAVSEIRKGLEMDGFYLSGRGQGGNQFVILPPESNQDIMQSYEREASEALRRGVILGTGTKLDTLDAEQRRRHEARLEKLSIKCLLLSKPAQFWNLAMKHSKKILTE